MTQGWHKDSQGIFPPALPGEGAKAMQTFCRPGAQHAQQPPRQESSGAWEERWTWRPQFALCPELLSPPVRPALGSSPCSGRPSMGLTSAGFAVQMCAHLPASRSHSPTAAIQPKCTSVCLCLGPGDNASQTGGPQPSSATWARSAAPGDL